MPISEKFNSVLDKLDSLIEQLDLYEAVLDALPQCLIVFDAKKKIIYANKCMLNLRGCTLEEIRGRKVEQVIRKNELVVHPAQVYGGKLFWVGVITP